MLFCARSKILPRFGCITDDGLAYSSLGNEGVQSPSDLVFL